VNEAPEVAPTFVVAEQTMSLTVTLHHWIMRKCGVLGGRAKGLLHVSKSSRVIPYLPPASESDPLPAGSAERRIPR
jgi:hypothetical protein